MDVRILAHMHPWPRSIAVPVVALVRTPIGLAAHIDLRQGALELRR